MHARCHVCRVGQRCPASVTLPWCGHSGVNAAFCTLFNGSDGIHPAYAAYFGPFSTFQLALFNLGSFSSTYHGTARTGGNWQPASGGAATRRLGTRSLHIEPRSSGAATRSCCACATLRAGTAPAARRPSRQTRRLGLWEFSAKARRTNPGSGRYSGEYGVFSEPIPTGMLSRLTLLSCHKRYSGASKRAQIW